MLCSLTGNYFLIIKSDKILQKYVGHTKHNIGYKLRTPVPYNLIYCWVLFIFLTYGVTSCGIVCNWYETNIDSLYVTLKSVNHFYSSVILLTHYTVATILANICDWKYRAWPGEISGSQGGKHEVFWDVELGSLIKRDRRFKEACCLYQRV
jgi:hypothetical protein